jgi:type I restriction enzyme S subunit
VTWVDTDFFPIDTAFYVKTLEVPLLWAYFLLKSLPLESMNTDSAVPGLNRSNALALEVARPTESVLSEFNRQALALIESAGRIHEEIDQLRRTRDELLPLLMSGKVRVRPEGVSA